MTYAVRTVRGSTFNPSARASMIRIILLLSISFALACEMDGKGKHSSSVDTLSLSCQECNIQLSTEVLLGNDQDSVGIQLHSRPIPFRKNGYLVAPAGDLAQLLEFDSAGRCIGSFGRQGDGPGEYRSIRFVSTDGDGRLAILDRRLSVLSPDLKLEASRAIPGKIQAFRMVSLSHGNWLLNNYSLPGRAFWILDSDLSPLRTFGDSVLTDSDDLQYQLFPDSEGGFWAAKVSYRFELDHYSSDGVLLKRLSPSSKWFMPWKRDNEREQDPFRQKPRSRITGLWVDTQGRLWIVGIAADAKWHATSPALVGSSSEKDYKMPTSADWLTLYDTMIEVIDSSSGTVLASRQYDGVLGGTMPNGRLWEFVERPSGGLGIRVIRASVSLH